MAKAHYRNLLLAFFLMSQGATYADEKPLPGSAPEKDTKLTGQSPDRMVFISGIIRMYNESLHQEPKNVLLRQRYIDFLLKYNQEEKALGQMKDLAAITPADGELTQRIAALTTKLSPPPAAPKPAPGVKKP